MVRSLEDMPRRDFESIFFLSQQKKTRSRVPSAEAFSSPLSADVYKERRSRGRRPGGGSDAARRDERPQREAGGRTECPASWGLRNTGSAGHRRAAPRRKPDEGIARRLAPRAAASGFCRRPGTRKSPATISTASLYLDLCTGSAAIAVAVRQLEKSSERARGQAALRSRLGDRGA